jgi:hypothetical protein
MGNLTYYPETMTRTVGTATTVQHWSMGVENVTPEGIRKALATLGMMFAPEETYGYGYIDVNSEAEHVYMPINVDGFYNGEYNVRSHN